MSGKKLEHPATLLAGAAHQIDPRTGALVPPIEPSTSYARDEHYEAHREGISYSRDSNATYLPAETVLRQIESGEDALLFASGLAAATAVFKTLRSGDHVVAPKIMYHGLRDWLTILGVPLGREMREDLQFSRETGSIIVVIGTDAPLSALSLRHLAKRASIGIGRHGTPGGNSSGDIFLAFSIANKRGPPQSAAAKQNFEFINNQVLDPCYLATVEAVEEAVVNAMVAAESMTTVKPAGRTCQAIDHDALREAMRRHGRLKE